MVQSLHLPIALFIVFCCYTTTALWCPSSACRGINNCVCKKSMYWKSESMKPANLKNNALHYVCRFADDARKNCGAKWTNCLEQYAGIRATFQKWTSWFRSKENRSKEAAINAATTGYSTGKCDQFL